MIHIDTGMHRLGLKSPEVAALAPRIREASPALAAYLTHFVAADEVNVRLCAEQVAAFHAAIEGLPPAPHSIANSSGLYLDPAWSANITRPGKALAGINPLPPGESSPVRQVMTVLAPILQVSEIAKGDSVGYAEAFRAARPMRIATLAIGYANGYLRSLSGRGIVAFAGRRAPLVGRVSMDLLTIDVTGVPDTALSDGVAEVLGPTIGLTELAGRAGTNEYETQISLGRGCRRVYVDGD
jgi:alanine racemase